MQGMGGVHQFAKGHRCPRLKQNGVWNPGSGRLLPSLQLHTTHRVYCRNHSITGFTVALIHGLIRTSWCELSFPISGDLLRHKRLLPFQPWFEHRSKHPIQQQTPLFLLDLRSTEAASGVEIHHLHVLTRQRHAHCHQRYYGSVCW